MTLTGIELPTESQYREYQSFTQDQLGLFLGDDKAYLLHGRLQRRMGELGLDSYADYFQMLAADQEGQERQRFSTRSPQPRRASTAKKSILICWCVKSTLS